MLGHVRFVIWEMWIIRESILSQFRSSEKGMMLNISTGRIYYRELVSLVLEGLMSKKRVERKHAFNCRKELLILELGKWREQVRLSEHRSPEIEKWGATRSQGALPINAGCLRRLDDTVSVWKGWRLEPFAADCGGLLLTEDTWASEAGSPFSLLLFSLHLVPSVGRSSWSWLAKKNVVCRV